MLKKFAVWLLVAQTIAVAIITLRSAKHYAAAMDAPGITALMSVAS